MSSTTPVRARAAHPPVPRHGGQGRRAVGLGVVGALLAGLATAALPAGSASAASPSAAQLLAVRGPGPVAAADVAMDSSTHVVYGVASSGGALSADSPTFTSANSGGAAAVPTATATASGSPSYDVLAVSAASHAVFAADSSAGGLKRYTAANDATQASLNGFVAQVPTAIAAPSGVTGSVGELAVDDAAGKLWVAYPTDQKVVSYDVAAGTWGTPVALSAAVGDIAVDGARNLLYAAVGSSVVAVSTTTGTVTRTTAAGGAVDTLAVDSANGRLFASVPTSGKVKVWTTAGASAGEWASGQSGNTTPRAIAVDGIHQQMYVSYSGSQTLSNVDVFSATASGFVEAPKTMGFTFTHRIGLDPVWGYALLTTTADNVLLGNQGAYTNTYNGRFFVEAYPVAIKSTSLADGQGPTAYSDRVVVANSYVLAMGSPYSTGLPPGYSIDSTGLVTGSATEAGEFEIQPVTNSYFFKEPFGSGSLTYGLGPAGRTMISDLPTSPVALTVYPGVPTFASTAFPSLVAGSSMSPFQVPATFMSKTVAARYPSAWVSPSWTISAGSLPNGLQIDSTTGVITGSPTTAGQYTFTVRATNRAGSSTHQYSVNVTVVPPSITTTTLPDGATGTAYQDQNSPPWNAQNPQYVPIKVAATGSGPMTFSITAGSLPPGLSMASDGTITGSPTTPGTFSFTVQAAGQANPPATQQLSITVPFQRIRGNSQGIFDVQVGVPFTTQLVPRAGTSAPVTWVGAAGGGDALPSSFSISSSGVLSGTATSSDLAGGGVNSGNAGDGSYGVPWTVRNSDMSTQPPTVYNATQTVRLQVVRVAPVLSGTAGNGSVTLTWPTLAADPTLGPPDAYDISDDGFTYTTVPVRQNAQNGASQSIVLNNLSNGTAYTYTVKGVWTSPSPYVFTGASNSVTLTPSAPIPAPASATATATGGANPSIGLSFPPASGSPSGYSVIINGGAPQPLTTSGSSPLTATVTSYNGQAITNGTAYTVQVVATSGSSVSPPVSAGTVTPDVAPGQVVLSSISGVNNGVTMTFPAPTNTGSAITKYEYTVDNGANWAQLSTTGSGPYTGTIGSLTNGTVYSVKVRAFNTLPGTPSAQGTATANPGPGAVTALTATPGNASASLSFTAPSSGAAVTGYQYSTNGGTTWQTLTTSGSAPVTATVSTGLTNGTAYTFQVRATSANGFGTSASAAAVTPDVAPGQVTLTSISGTNNGAQVTFPAPTNTGSAITRYEYTTDGGSTWTSLGYTGSGPYTGTISGTSASPGTPLTNGTVYSVQVRAFNTLPGTPSTSGSVTPNPVPGAVTGLSSTPGNGQVSLSFTAPSTGAAVTGYQYSTNGGTSWQTLTTSGSAPVTGTVTGLTNGSGASVMVRATSANGPGSSATAPTVVPNTPPPAPGAVTATPSSGGATLSFAAPTGGTASSITGYQYSTNGGTTWQSLTVTSGAGVSPVTASVSGLTNGTATSIVVQAVAPQGTSSSTSPVSVTPVGAPGAPTGGAVTNASVAGGAAAIGLSFTPATSTSANPVTGYAVSINGGPYQPVTTSGSSPLTASLSSYVGQPLTNGTSYQVNVVALNAGGQGAVLNAGTVTPNVAPGAVTISSITGAAGGGGATVVFPAAVTNGGSAVTGYQYQVNGTGSWVTLPTSGSAPVTGTITGLTNGTASSIAVRAVNSTMQGAASAAASVTPYAAPAAPGAVTATAGNASVALSFAPATSTAQAPVTGYLYSTTSASGPWVPLTGLTGSNPLTTTLTSLSNGSALVNGTPVTVYVQAVGTGGTSSVVTSAAVTPAPTVPSVPLNLSVTAAAAALDLSFYAPATDGGSAITKYQYSTDAGAHWVDLTIATTLPSGGMTARITTQTSSGTPALANGSAYTVAVRAVNAVGDGPATAGASGTPVALPGAPQLMSVTPSNGQAQIAFVPNANNPAGTTYQVSTSGANGPWTTLTTTAGTGAQAGQLVATVTGLTNGSPVTFTLQALAPSNLTSQPVAAPAVTPNQLPAAPTNVSATSLPTGATLTFTAPAGNAGLGVTGYGVIVNGTGSPLPLTVTSAQGASPVTGTVAGLVNGTGVSLTVVALAPQGSSAPSSPAASVTPYGIPAAPASLTTSVGNTQLGLSFPAVTSTPGTPVTGYQYSLNGAAGPWLPVVPTSAAGASPVTTTVTGLTNGTGYAVQVRSVNSLATPAITSTSGVGTSPVTTAPGAVPDVPVALVASGTSAAVTLTFAEPLSAGSSPVSGYEVSTDGGQTWTALSTSPTAGAPGPYTATLGSLTNGTTYTVLVHAVNAVGAGLHATAVGIPGSGAPSAPRNLVLTPGVGTATATFTPPATAGGSAITGYAYQVGGQGPWLPLTTTAGSGGALTASITGLTGGQATSIAIAAVTASGLTPPAGAAVTGPVTPTSAPVSPPSGGGSGGGPTPTPSPSGSGSSLPPLAPGTVPPVGQAAPPVMVAPGTIRIAGPTRLQTATALSTSLWPSAQTVPALVVMSSDVAADGIAGSRLAQAVGGPMLLTAPGSLSADTRAEISRVLMAGGKVYVLGGENAVSARVFDQIDGLPGSPSVVRLAGADRYETSVKIAQAIDGMGRASGPAYVGAGTDAAMTAPLAARTGGVVLLTQDGKLPASVATYLAGKQTVVAVGGPAARSLPSAASVVGSDRYDTSSKVAAAYTSATGAAPTVFAVANGENWPDQVTGGASMALLGGPLLLTQPSELNGNAKVTIGGMSSLKAGVVVGGTQAVSPSVETSLRAMGF